MLTWLQTNKGKLVLILVVLATGYWLGRRERGFAPQVGVAKPKISPVRGPALEVGGQLSRDLGDEESPSPPERLVVKTASLSLLVKDVRESAAAMQRLAADSGGFVVAANISVSDEKKGAVGATVTIRVPTEKFDEVLDSLKKRAVKVTSEMTLGKDVTEQYTDLQARRRNLEAAEAQLLKIMEQAGEIKDVLAVQQELTRVREQIETTTGRIKFLEESTKQSKITAYFATEEEGLPLVEERWRPLATAKAALRSLISFWRIVADRLLFWGIFLSPIFLPLLVIGIWRRWRG